MSTSEDPYKQFKDWVGLVTGLAFIAALKSSTQEHASAFLIMLSLLGIGLMMLMDQDRWRKSGSTHTPLPLHVVAALLGVLASNAINASLRFNNPPYLVRLFVSEFTILIFFLLLELSIDKNVRKDSFYSLPGMTCWLAYIITSPVPLFRSQFPHVDGGAIAILFAAIFGGAIHSLRTEMDPVPLERKYVYIWAAISILVLSAMFVLPSR